MRQTGGTSGKESASNAGDENRHGFDPWIMKIPWRRSWQPTPVFLPGESPGQRSLVGYSPWGPTESDTTAVTYHACTYVHTHTHTHTWNDNHSFSKIWPSKHVYEHAKYSIKRDICFWHAGIRRSTHPLHKKQVESWMKLSKTSISALWRPTKGVPQTETTYSWNYWTPGRNRAGLQHPCLRMLPFSRPRQLSCSTRRFNWGGGHCSPGEEQSATMATWQHMNREGQGPHHPEVAVLPEQLTDRPDMDLTGSSERWHSWERGPWQTRHISQADRKLRKICICTAEKSVGPSHPNIPGWWSLQACAEETQESSVESKNPGKTWKRLERIGRLGWTYIHYWYYV